MPHYEPIARRFRPQSFRDVFEQMATVQILKNAISHGRISQAYLFCGSKGTGKTTLARIFAKALNCNKLTADFEPCNTCQNCLEITAGHSLDVLEVDGASNRGIDDIRQLNETVSYLPSSSTYKIYIIDEVHMLTKEAFNALLKTLEEPPSHVKFFFATTEPHKVLPTIISRCQRFDLSRISSDNIAKKLKKIASSLEVHISDDALLALSKLSDGSLRDAESLLDQILCYEKTEMSLQDIEEFLGLPSKDYFLKLCHAIIDYDLSYAFNLTETLCNSGKDLTYFIEGLIEFFQDLLKKHLKIKHLPIAITHESDQDKRFLEHISTSQCLHILDELMKHLHGFSQSSFKRVHLDMLLLNLIRSSRKVPLDILIQTLDQLKQSSPQIKPSSISKEQILPSLPEEKLDLPQKETLLSDHEVEPLPSLINEKTPLNEQTPDSHASKLHRYETLMRFTSIELGGTLKKY